MPQRKQRTLQFSLTALLLVVTGVSLAVSFYVVRRNGTKEQQAQRQLTRFVIVALAVNKFWDDNGRIPTEGEGLNALTSPGASPAGPYLQPTDVVDPWGSEVVYVVWDGSRADGFDLRSLGPNGIDDGGAHDDISLKHGFDRAPYDAVDLRTAVGTVFLGLIIGVFLFVARIFAASGQQLCESEVAASDSESSEAPP